MAQNAMKLVYGVSFAVHLGGGAALVAYEEHRPPAPVVVEMRTVERQRKPAAEAPPPPPPPPPRERAPRAERPAAPAQGEAPPPVEAQAPASDVPDFGFALSGVGAGGASGIAVPVGNGGRAPAVTRQAARTLAAATPGPRAAEGDCEEAEVRPRPLSAIPRPAYTDDARQAQVEGRVRIELAIDENGRVTSARVLEPLGHGLDEAALAAVREASFSPATRCGRPVAATVKIGLTFTLGV